MRLNAAIAAGKLTGEVSRRLKLGGGTTLPGAVACRVEPRFIARLAARLPQGTILVTGTNGKTTTARMLSTILRHALLRPVHNRAGANLLGGVAAALVRSGSLLGGPGGDIGLFEVDEAALPLAVAETQPRVVLITNLFRDQLDRYGEVDYLAGLWMESLHRLGPETTLVLNADDPLVAGVGRGAAARVLYYGLQDLAQGSTEPQRNADARNCGVCGGPYSYETSFYAHLGWYSCPQCGLTRPVPQVGIRRVRPLTGEGSHLELDTPRGRRELALHLPGLYNSYNATAALAAGLALDLPDEAILPALEEFHAAFGRVEEIRAEGRNIYLALVKNPVGFDEVLRTVLALASGESPGRRPVEPKLLIIINDNFADGTDISWLWDVDFERLAGRAEWAVVSGTRAEDMAVRLKYAGVGMDRVQMVKDTKEALTAALQRTPEGGTLCLLPTYTAMLDVRAEMARRGWVSRFWED